LEEIFGKRPFDKVEEEAVKKIETSTNVSETEQQGDNL